MTGRRVRNLISGTGLAVLIFLSACQQQPSLVRVHHYGNTSGGGSLGIHTLKGKENLWTIAQSYHVDLRDILDANNLQAPYHLPSGTRLKIPAPNTYKIEQGDTIYSVSRLFNVSATDLARINRLQPPYAFTKGQFVTLPGAHMPDAKREAKTASLSSVGMAAPVAGVDRTPLAAPAIAQGIAPSVKPVIRDDGKGFLRPVDGPVISGYGPKSSGLHNDGINFRTMRGAPVRAAKAGEIVYAGSGIEGYGNLVLIRHSDGFVTAYAHLDKMLGKKGDVVKRGQVIGKAGTTGHVGTPQLHFEIRKGRDALDPAQYL